MTTRVDRTFQQTKINEKNTSQTRLGLSAVQQESSASYACVPVRGSSSLELRSLSAINKYLRV